MKIKGILFILAACVAHISAMERNLLQASEILRKPLPSKIQEGQKIADDYLKLVATFPRTKTQEDYLTALGYKWKKKYNEDLGFSIKNYLEIPALKAKMPEITGDGVLFLTKMHLNSLEGLEDIPNIASVKALYLSQNQISSIEPNTFANLKNLELLSLASNKISTVAPKAFANLKNLKLLILASNQISTIDDAFAGLEKLKTLHLQNNRISSIDEAFAGLDNLEELILQNNQISTIEPETFANLANLIRLWLNDNQISTITLDTIANLKNLSALLIGGNPLTEETKKALREQFGNRVMFR